MYYQLQAVASKYWQVICQKWRALFGWFEKTEPEPEPEPNTGFGHDALEEQMRVIRTQLSSICERMPRTVPARSVLAESFEEDYRRARRQSAKNYPESPRWLLETPNPTPKPKIFLPRKESCLIPAETPKKALVLDLPLEILDYIVS